MLNKCWRVEGGDVTWNTYKVLEILPTTPSSQQLCHIGNMRNGDTVRRQVASPGHVTGMKQKPDLSPDTQSLSSWAPSLFMLLPPWLTGPKGVIKKGKKPVDLDTN